MKRAQRERAGRDAAGRSRFPLLRNAAGQVDEWLSIEISGGELEIFRWVRSRGRDVVRTALEHGARDGDWVSGTWGVVLEFCFADTAAAFRTTRPS